MAATTAAAVLNLLLSLFWISLLFLSGSLQLCIDKERKALLNVRSGFPDIDRRLSPWKGDSCCSWEGVGCNNITGHVIELDLSLIIHPLQSGATVLNRSKVHPSLFHLKHLEYLDISGNNLSGHQIPGSIGSLTQLQHLNLSQCYFGGEIPHQLGNLSNLQGLFLPDNQIEGVIPKTIGNLTALQSLRLSDNQISGKIPDSIGNLLQLEFFDISGNNISGSIPDNLGSLCNLSTIDLSYNSVKGSVVEFFEQLSRCRTNKPLSLDLHENQFSGLLPSHFERLQRLVHLDLGSNQLNGSVPASLGKLSALGFLSLYSNNLAGDITEAHFANLTSLKRMEISDNNLSVKVSQDWLPPFQAEGILMGSCNLGPKFPPWLQNQTSLSSLDITNNGISDAFPDWFWSSCRSNLELDVSRNHMTGMLPSSLECFKDVRNFNLSYNNFEGFIPRMQLSEAYLDFSHNSFSGPIPSSLVDNAVYISLLNNRLNGSIPSSICTEIFLQAIDLANNDLSGTLPDCFRYESELMILDVSNNKLSGSIPSTLGFLQRLQSLHLSNNRLSGTVPTTLIQCIQLVVIDFSWNELSGDILSWIGPELSSLRVLSLRSNKFTGEIPSELSLIPSLQVLDLAHNLFFGLLPPSFGNFSAMMINQNHEILPPLEVLGYNLYCSENLVIIAKDSLLFFTTTLSLVTSIDLSSNNLSGVIPEELTNLHGLRFLNLSFNYFSGQIPEKIGLMSQLESLDFSKNNLSGRIPSSISALTFLTALNLSYNNLVGKIPVGPQLQTFTDLSYVQNPGLCGEPLETKCFGYNQTNNDGVSEEEHLLEDDEYERIWYFLGFALGFVFGFWGFMGAVMINRSIRIKYILIIDWICSWFMRM
ncbi:receptor-like protein EIX2 [Curcuma longa]|uniref:receptor-like protein EIX2 n=1 Tax=Curcuma longa TaxID=136217 RepID=UPI003D9EA745